MKYSTIVADPPWPFTWQAGTGGRRRNKTELGYSVMSLADILTFRPPSDGDSTLFLWTIQPFLHSGAAQAVAITWGFDTRVGEIVWRKPNFGTGVFPRCGHETCLIYKRNGGSLRRSAARNVHSVQEWAQDYSNHGGKRHSAKPDGFYDLIEQGFNGPYLELFARRQRLGWDTWGNEALNHTDLGDVA